MTLLPQAALMAAVEMVAGSSASLYSANATEPSDRFRDQTVRSP
jgi:hypothetical protein